MTAKIIGVIYCGGCNPRIDRRCLAEEIEKRLPPGCRVSTDRATGPWEKAVLICGCPVACAEKPTLKRLARKWIRVGGTTIDLESVPAEYMADIIVKKLRETE